jgi:DNA-binding beta-propeller fold protein YncE
MDSGSRRLWAAVALAAVLAAPVPVHADKKKKNEAPAPKEKSIIERLDYSKIVWPNPPAITRIKYLNYFAAEKYVPQAKPKSAGGWMARMAGGAADTKADVKPLYQLATPYGLAVDSKGNVYVADGKVGAVFIFNTETKDVEMIKHGVHAQFGLIIGLAMDDNDRLFVSDSKFHRVLVFNKNHRVEATVSEGMVDPGGIAIDTENRFLYVADVALDQVLVYDADNYKLLRKMGTAGKDHSLTSPGDFSKPTNVAVDKDGNLYVADTYNNRIEIFDPDGGFISTFGKAGDGPGYFARPKGVAIDADGHIWVADAVQDRVQVFNREGKLLIWMGGHGTLPGQFRDVAGLAIDKQNRVFTSEQFPGRVQMFRYVTQAEARAEYERRQAMEKPADTKQQPVGNAPAATSDAKVQNDPAKTPSTAVRQ